MVTIENIPPRFNNDDTVSENSLFGFTISTENPLAIAVKPSTKEKPLENIPIKTAATDDNSITGTIGFLAKAPHNIMTKGSNIKMFQLNIALSSEVKPITLSEFAVPGSRFMPTINQTIRPASEDGIVVHSICFMWSYKSTSATKAERFVVSERGDSLSPKIAPEIMAPAAIPKGTFISIAIPISATPAVADEPQAVPVATDTTAVITKAVTRK